MVAAVNSAHNTYSSTGSYGTTTGGYGGGPTGAASSQEGMNISVLAAGHSAPPRSATNLITIHAQVIHLVQRDNILQIIDIQALVNLFAKNWTELKFRRQVEWLLLQEGMLLLPRPLPSQPTLHPLPHPTTILPPLRWKTLACHLIPNDILTRLIVPALPLFQWVLWALFPTQKACEMLDSITANWIYL